MALVKLKFAPGLLANSTLYSRSTRWVDSNLMRWIDSGIKVVGGWERFLNSSFAPVGALYTNPSAQAPRGIFVWSDNDSTNHIFVGTNQALFYINNSGAVFTKTPSGFVVQPRNPTLNSGYGLGLYGGQSYGTPRLGPNLASTPVSTWKFDNWGEDLLALCRGNGPIYSWSPDDAAVVAVPNCPADLQDFVVTTERIVMGIGGSNARLVQWSDSENRELWTPAVTNQAGDKILTGKGRLLAIRQMLNQILILSQTDAHIGIYTGPPFIYDFKKASEGCGLMAANALITMDSFAMWPSGEAFWYFDGSIKRVESEVANFFYNDLSKDKASKTFGYSLKDFSEFVWLYQSNQSPTDEPDKYVSYNYVNKTWAKGTIYRVVAADSEVSKFPIMVSADGLIFNHEIESVSVSGVPSPFVETGPIELGAGDNMLHCDMLYPDFEAVADATITVFAKDMPRATERVQGPKTITSPTTLRSRGRTLRFRFSSGSAGFAVGDMRVDFKKGAKR